MSKVAVVARNFADYQNTCRRCEIADDELVLWGADFSLFSDAEKVDVLGLGDGVSAQTIARATDEIHETLRTWFRDESGQDLSSREGVSLGLVFESTLEELFYNLVRSYLGMEALLKQYDRVVVNGRDEPVIALVSRWFNQTEKGRIQIGDWEEEAKGKGMKVHPFHGLRDLNFALNGRRLDRIIGRLLMWFQWRCRGAVFVMDAGKFEDYQEQHSKQGAHLFRLLIPIRRRWKSALGHCVYWQRTLPTQTANAEAWALVDQIAEKGWCRSTQFVPKGLFQLAVEEFVLPYWGNALVYYRYYKRLFERFRPRLAIYGTDGWMNHLLSAFAAKEAGVPTAMLPHATHIWGAATLHSEDAGRFGRLFDYMFAVGQLDEAQYRGGGIAKGSVIPVNLPWFSRADFVRANRPVGQPVRKVMLLPLDAGFSVSLTPTSVHRHMLEMIETCEKLGVEIHGIKFRSLDMMRAWGMQQGKNRLFGREINAFGGYGSLSDHFDDVDGVIGPFCSAAAECTLAGVSYFTYHDYEMYARNPNMHKAFGEFLYVASTPGQLEENLQGPRVFRPGYDASYLVNVAAGFEDACVDLDRTITQMLHSGP